MKHSGYTELNSPAIISKFPPLNLNQTVNQRRFQPRLGPKKGRLRFNAFVKDNMGKKSKVKIKQPTLNRNIFDALQNNVKAKLPDFSKGLKGKFKQRTINRKTVLDYQKFQTVVKDTVREQRKRSSRYTGRKKSKNQNTMQRMMSPSSILSNKITPIKLRLMSPLPARPSLIQKRDTPSVKYEVFYRKRVKKPKERYSKQQESFKISKKDITLRESSASLAVTPQLPEVSPNKPKPPKKPRKPEERSTTKMLYEYLNDFSEKSDKHCELKETPKPQINDSQFFYNLTKGDSSKSILSLKSAVAMASPGKKASNEKSKFHKRKADIGSSRSSSSISQSERSEKMKILELDGDIED